MKFGFSRRKSSRFRDEPNTVKREVAWEHDRFMVVHPDGDNQTTWNVIEKRDCAARWIFILKAYYNKQVLSVQALIVFTIFWFLVDEKIKCKVLDCSFEITY